MTAYELVYEACHALGGGKSLTYSDVLAYVHAKCPDCPFKEMTFRLHMDGL